MKNREIAKILYEIGDYLEMEGVAFKPVAYRNAAQVIEAMDEDIAAVYHKGGFKALTAMQGIGEAIARKIEEYIQTDHMRYWEELKVKTPIHLEELTAIEGLGPKKVKMLYDKLGIRTVKDLERAVRSHKVAGLSGFGEKTEENILQGIAFLKRDKGRFLLGDIFPKAREIYEYLGNMPEVKKIALAGSIRRMKETIGDVDLLIVSAHPEKVMDAFVNMKGVEKIWGHGATKSSIRLREGFDVDLRVVPYTAYGAALQYFTGSKEHNIRLRTRAMDKGMKLNEYGLFKGKEMLSSDTEEDIYRHLDMQWIPPEIRQDQGEVEASLKGQLPRLIELKDIKGDLHIHSDWDGGRDSIETLVKQAKELGYQYIGIADHTKFLKIERGLDEGQLRERNKEIDRMNKMSRDFKILKGCEANIMPDGSIDITDAVLKEMDFVIAGVHSQLKMAEGEMTKRLTKAMENPHVDIISHPTGRIIQKRDEYRINPDTLIQTAKRTNTVLEINSFPQRLDLHFRNIRKARDAGVKMVINTDSHASDHMHFMELGVAQARRGWAQREDIINSHTVDGFLSHMKH